MLIDNCIAHPPDIENLKAIPIEILHSNVTFMLQPLDQGVIHSFKLHYQKSIDQEDMVLTGIENKKLNDKHSGSTSNGTIGLATG